MKSVALYLVMSSQKLLAENRRPRTKVAPVYNGAIIPMNAIAKGITIHRLLSEMAFTYLQRHDTKALRYRYDQRRYSQDPH